MKTLNLHDITCVAGGAIDKEKLRADMLKAHQERMAKVSKKTESQRKAAYEHLEGVKNRLKEKYSPLNMAKNMWNNMWEN